LQISYELAYKDSYAIKVIIQTINDLDISVSFPAKFKALKSKEEFNLNCHNVSSTEIECYTDKGVDFLYLYLFKCFSLKLKITIYI
jgi:hypothetical protein